MVLPSTVIVFGRTFPLTAGTLLLTAGTLGVDTLPGNALYP